MDKEIRHQFTFAQPPEVVWEFLTNSQLLAEWLMPNDFKPIVGHKFQFRAKPKFPLGFDGTIYCEVLEIVPFSNLVYSWMGGMSKDKPTLNSVVTWTLKPSDNGTILTLQHAGFKGMRNYIPYIIMNKGWLKIGNRLSKKVNQV